MKHVVYWKLPGTAAAEEGAKTSPEFKVMMMREKNQQSKSNAGEKKKDKEKEKKT